MNEQNKTTTCVTKEETKLEIVECQVDTNNENISEIYNIISNIEERLGEENQSKRDSPGGVEVEPASRLVKLKSRLYGTHIDLLEIRDRLTSILLLF